MTKPAIYQVVSNGTCLFSGNRLACENYITEHKFTVMLVREEIKAILVR
jgi:hypothetical protein